MEVNGQVTIPYKYLKANALNENGKVKCWELGLLLASQIGLCPSLPSERGPTMKNKSTMTSK